MNEKAAASEQSFASVLRNAGVQEEVSVHGFFEVWCVRADGTEKWRDTIKNLVTSVGKDDLLNKYFRGSGYTQTVVLGLCGAGTKAVGDTQASHAGWSEVGGTNAPAYTGNRKAITLGAASGNSAVSSSQAFAITSSGTIAGCFTNNGGSVTKDDTTGVLYSAGNFTNGDKVVSNTDTVNVVYTASIT